MINPTAPVPTDNLYKFLAISGLVGTALLFWFPEQAIDQKKSLARVQARQLEELAADLHEMRYLDDKWLGLPSEPDDDRPSSHHVQSADDYSEETREAIDRFMEKMDAWLRDLADESATEEGKRRFFEDDSLCKRLKSHRNWDEKQLNDWIEKLSLNEFNLKRKPVSDLARKIRATTRDARFEMREFDALVDKIKYYRRLSWTGVSISAVVAGIGFYLWFVRVQKAQDRVLSLELKELESRVTKTSQGD